MDGNRRYAKKHQLQRIVGHTRGYQTLLEVLKWCNELDVKVATVYAFALDNFKRSRKEVESLMELATRKFTEMLDSEKTISQYGVRVQVLGALDRLPTKLQHVMARVMQSTRGHTKLTLNIAFAYSARYEVQQAAVSIRRGVMEGDLKAEDSQSGLLERCLYTSGLPEPDLLIRTSGETRLSDFLVSQCRRGTYLSFVKALWPELSFWNFFGVVFAYQRHHASLVHDRRSMAEIETKTDAEGVDDDNMEERILRFIEKRKKERERYIDRLAVQFQCASASSR
uniref:Alkyl transferase n=1 Tax=Lotharella oceanica TaxID=641309 RepID=A0A7S2X7R2_9EUKA